MGLVTESEDPSCYGRSDGEIEVEGYFGKLPYTYSWSHNPSLNQAQAYNLPAGDYTVTITDALGEQTTVSKTLIEPQPVGFSAIITSVQCYGDSTGAADVTVLNASGTPAFDWSNGATTEDVTDLKADTYTLTVTDALGCTAFGVITVDEPDSMSLALAIDQDIRCAGDSTAMVTATASGGMDLFSYQWNDPLYQTTATATSLPAGTWTVTAMDANGCTRTDSVVLTQPVAISLSLTATDPTCAGLDNGSALATAGGGTGTLSYAWSNGPAVAANNDLTSGTYAITVTDDNLCTETDSVTLHEPAALTLDAVTPTDATCFGYEDGTLAISASGGTGTLHYSIDGTHQFIVPLFDSLAAGTYTVTVTDSLDCTAETTAEITQPDGMTLTLLQLEEIACHGAATASATVTVTGATGTVSYLWDDPEAQTADTALNLLAGDYSVQVTDASGCKVTDGITVVEPNALTIDTTEVVHIDETNLTGSVSLEATGGTAPFTFVMLPDSTSGVSGVFDELAAGDYAFFASDQNGCSSDDLTVSIIAVEPGNGLIFYDAFSPNGDAKNDVWNIRHIDKYPNCTVKIFNSWGTPVFSSKGYGTPWDGKNNGHELPAGTYYYLIDPGDGSKTLSGPVSLVK
jgi:gliding motility-associated-like protein